jgi:hypothetical protein
VKFLPKTGSEVVDVNPLADSPSHNPTLVTPAFFMKLRLDNCWTDVSLIKDRFKVYWQETFLAINNSLIPVLESAR